MVKEATLYRMPLQYRLHYKDLWIQIKDWDSVQQRFKGTIEQFKQIYPEFED